MDDSEDNMSSEDVKKVDSSSLIKKPKKRSLVERELETNMTARMTSPAAVGEGLSTSRYGRARRLKTNAELIESQKVLLASMKSPTNENTPVKVQSPVYRMHASNSPQKVETPQKALVTYLDNQIDNIYQENISLSRFSEDTNSQSPAKKYPKVYIRKDLIQNREEEESIMLIQHLFSPTNSGSKQSPLPTTTLTTPNVASVQSTEKYVKQNGYIDNSSVVKTLDFDNKIIKKKEDKGQRGTLSKNELFEIEATCPYQVGDLAWARVGTFPFWPCIITRDPYSEMYVKKKLFGRVTHDIIHVTFFGDNGRRSWIVDNMLRKYLGLLEFESTREKFTSEDKKKDPRLYAAFFVSDKKQALWNMSVQEAETLLREPKRLRIDVFNDMLWKSRASKKPPKSNKISSRTNSDVSLSESLYDSLFSEKEDKPDEIEHSKKSKNKSFDVSEVVTACLDNMAAKTGITKIQRQSHMDRWLQKAKSKTPEKTQAKTTVMKMDKPEKNKKKYSPPGKLNRKSNFTINSNSVSHNKPYRFRRKTESQSTLTKFVNQNDLNNCTKINDSKISSTELSGMKSASCDENINKENNSTLNISTVILVDDADDVKNTTISKDEPIVQNIGESVNENSHTIKVGKADSISDQTVGVNIHNSKIMPVRDDLNDMKNQVNQKTTIDEAKKADTEFHENKSIEISAVDSTIVTSRSTNDLNADTVIQSDESVLSSVTQRDANSAQPVELSKENSNVFVETICNKSDLNYQDSLTDFDKKSSDVETIQKQNENKCFSDLTDNLIMEVDNCPNFDSEANGDKNPNSKTVSNKNMGSNIVSDLKEAQNDVTIEVSVTEKKNDETLNNLPREGEQEIVNKPNPSKINKPNIDTTLFLHEILNKEIVSTDEVIAPEKTSTPEKTEIHKINEKFRNATAKKLNLESDITLSSSSNNNIRNEEDARELKDGRIDNCTKNVGAEGSYDDELDDGNVTMDCINDKLNDTGNSESVLHVYTEEPVIEKDEAVLDTSLNVSTQSESILENSQIDGGAQENDAMIETVADIRNEIGFVAEENERSASRQCVESPTFTQYIDSEDLFRDVSDKHSSSEKHNKQLIKPKEMSVKEVEKKTQIDNIKEIVDDYDDTSEDEPSPEYESLDDEITEDFRKHMMSIESNIKDSKDEEQIVKICNEIAEKAKLSPTKYGEDQEISKSIDKIDTNSNNVLITSSKDNIELKIKNNYDKVDNEKVNDSSLGEHHIKVDMKSIQTNLLDILDSSIYKQNKLKELQIEARKSLNLTDEQTPIVVKTDVAENVKDNTAQSNEISTKVNGDADLLEIPDKPKMIYRTRSSMTSASKDRASPDVKIKSSVIEKYIKRCEYEPKVVIIRLERDKLEYSKGTNKSKHLDEDKPGCNENHIEYVSKEDDIDDNRIRIENKAENIKNKRSVVDKEDKSIKSRLSLRRKSNTTENNIIHNQSEIKAAKPTNTSVPIMKEVVKTSKQIEIKNDIKMDEIVTSEPIKLNGYHHNLYRKFTGTPDSLADTDFDLDAASVNSEDSEVSLPNSIESMPRRNLRSRPEKTLEYALKSPEFLKYLEVRQDYLMDLHPELNADEVVAYIHKSWQYEEDLKSDSKIIEDVRKQETPSRSKKSKKTDPKNRIKDYFCENYEKSKKTINFDSEPGAIDNSTKIFEQKMETNTEKNISKIETSEKLKKLSNSSESVDLTLDTINDISIDKDKCDMDTVSVESEESSTPRRSLRSKTAPKCLNKDIYYLDDILVLDGTIQKERDLNDKPATEEKIKKGQDLNNKTASKEKVQKDQHVTNENILENKLNLKDSLLCEENTQNKRDLTDTPRKKIQKDRDLKHNSTLENKILKEHDLDVKISLDEKIENERDLNAKSTPEEKIQKDRDIKETPISKEKTHKVRDNKKSSTPEEKIQKYKTVEKKIQRELDIDCESVDSEDSEIPLRQLRSKVLKENENMNGTKKVIGSENKLEVTASKEPIVNIEIKDEQDEIASTVSDNEPLVKQKQKPADKKSIDDPAFIQYLQLKQDSLMDENPQLSQEEIIQYLYKSWLYDEKAKSALDMNNELEKLATSPSDKIAPIKKVRLKQKVEKQTENPVITPREKPRRRIAQPFYNENYSDIEDELEVFEIFKTKKSAITVVSKAETDKDKSPSVKTTQVSPKATTSNDKAQNIDNEPLQVIEDDDDLEYANDTEIYFADLTKPKPNVFKGLIREKVCEICEYAGSLVKCKVCYGMFHPDCVKNQVEQSIEVKESPLPIKGRKKRRKLIRKSKTEDSESQSDEKSHDMSADTSIEDIVPPELLSIDAQYIESQLEAKMKDILTSTDINYDSYSSDDGIDWESSIPGKCEIVDVKLKRRDPPIDYSDFKCNDCLKHGVPVCFVCKSAVSKTNVKMRQKCHIAHCHKYYHLECLDHWPQTQFVSGEPSKSNKKKNEFFDALTCPRHVCHTCVSDDPRGCKTRFSWDKLAKCVRCPATYHSFNKCLPAGTQVLTASHIICPRHSEQKGRIPCHVNTGWCFICALGGSLICCEYCPTSFHAECLNIKPPEGNYMCEDCETGRLPLYGEMVWVKLGQYRWWPGIILHPSEIPENIMAVKHELGDFVVRFFGQYDHYWVNRGRVFPYQEGDSGKISSQKSKINEDFICAMEHAQRAYAILKNAVPDEEESLDIASSLLPPHYVKLKSNKPSGALCGRRIEDPALSLTQCECDPAEPDPCGPYSQCLNRMLLTECGPTCRAGERCNNRAFEKRLYPKLVPYRTPHRGWGLKTLEDIKAGQFVIEYVGELIDEEEYRRRMRRKHEIRDENFYFLTLDKERMIDAGPKGNVARFMNHCCEPNCETQKWTVLGDIRVGLFAIQDIPANSEVTFNYNLECAGIEKKLCLCGAKRCSGYIGAKPKQDESQSKKGKEVKIKRAYNKKKKPEGSPSTVVKIKKRLGRPPKPKPLTEIEKDVLIIKNATSLSSDIIKIEDKGLKKKITSMPSEQVSLCNGKGETKSLKRKRISISMEEVSICNGQEPCAKKQKCMTSEVGD